MRFPTPNAGASDWWERWGRVPAAWAWQEARRVARRTGGELEDIHADIQLEAVVLLRGKRCGVRYAIARAGDIAERRARPESLTCYRPQNIGRCGAAGARISPADWRALFAWLRRELPDGRPRQVLERTLRGESLELIADELRVSLGAVKTARSKALARCRHALRAGST